MANKRGRVGTTIVQSLIQSLWGAVMITTVSACSYGTFFIPKQQKFYGPTEPSAIAISPQRDLKLAYEKLGRVAVVVSGNGDGARVHLQNEAAKLGANAVIDLKVKRTFWRTSASGLAVRIFTN